MSESLLPHMNTFYKRNTIFNLEGKIRELDRNRTIINSDDIDYKIEQINKEHSELLEELEIEELDQITNPNNPSFGIATSQETIDDIDWTEDKPEGGIPFYCPICHMTIEEQATWDGVFQHNKQLHDMSDEDAETLAKGFTYSNSPPTSEESKASEGLSATGDWWNSLSKNEREEVLKKVYITKDNVVNADDWEIIYLGDFDYLSYWVWGKLETYHDEVIQPKTKEEKEREENAELSSSDWWDRHGDAVIGKLTESKANEEGLDWTTPHTEDKNCQHPNCVGARAEDILFNNFVSLRGGGMKCNHCGKYWSDEPENTFNSAQVLNQPIVQDLLHHARTHGIEY